MLQVQQVLKIVHQVPKELKEVQVLLVQHKVLKAHQDLQGMQDLKELKVPQVLRLI